MTHTASHHGELTMQTHNLRACKYWAALATMALCSCFGTESGPRKGVRLAPVIAIDEDTADCQPIFHERNARRKVCCTASITGCLSRGEVALSARLAIGRFFSNSVPIFIRNPL